MNTISILRRLVTLAALLAWFVVMLGAYTRLTEAGLGCPDWPGCYGRMAVSALDTDSSQAQALFPETPIESRKAWTEMLHRYAAGSLALLIVLINGLTYALKRCDRTPLLLLVLLCFQALLGMWTVTLKLLPLVVMGHLLGGILIFSLLCYFRVQISQFGVVSNEFIDDYRWRPWVLGGVVILLGQIALGGWVSSNYAGVSCVGFPQCNGSWWPVKQILHAFNPMMSIGANYQGGMLDSEARVTIQCIHRLGAVVVAVYLWVLAILIVRRVHHQPLRRIAVAVMVMVSIQWVLGILNVVYLLPLTVAVLHNGVAALLFALSVVMLYWVSGGRRHARVS